MKKGIDLAELMVVDYVVVSGMNLCDEFIENQGPILKNLSARKTKIIFNGCGGRLYDRREIDNFRKFLSDIKVHAFISRDNASFHNYKDSCSKSYNGIDCGFFLSDMFDPAPLIINNYVVYNFDSIEEPDIENTRKILRTHHSCSKIFPGMANKNAILTVRTRTPFLRIHRRNSSMKCFKHSGTLISEAPEDYLNLYAHAYAVHSDRVHACVVALSFGNLARLYSASPRGALFDRVRVGEIKNRLVKLDQTELAIEKKNQISFLKEIFQEC